MSKTQTQFSDPDGGFDLSYASLAGCQLPFLMFTQAALEAAFPDADIRPERISFDGRDQDVFSFCAADNETPIFHVTWGGDEWNEKAGDYKPTFNTQYLSTTNSAVTALGRYRIGQTRFADFKGAQITECGFWVDGSKIVCQGNSPGTTYDYSRFIFNSPEDFKGDFKEAPPEILAKAVLAQIDFYVGGEKYKSDNSIAYAFTEAEATKQIHALIKAQKPGLLKRLLKSPPAGEMPAAPQPQEDLMALLLKDRFYVSEAREAYLALAEIAVYPLDPDFVKAQIDEIFKSNPDEEPTAYLFAVSDIAEEDFRQRFLLSLDWKEEISELHHKIGFAFGGNVAALNLPDLSEFPANKSIALPGVLERYTEALFAAGYDFSSLDTGADTYIFCITPVSHSDQVKTLLAKAAI